MPVTIATRFSAPLDAIAVAVRKGNAVCLAISLQAYTLATSANRSALGTSAPTITGLTLTDGNANQAVEILCAGIADASIVGALSGSGKYVNVQSDGTLARSTAITSDTIGYAFADGSVLVDASLQTGAGGNAQQIQGTPVGTTAAAYSQELAANGSQIRSRRGVFNLLDFRQDGVPFDGSTADMNASVLALNTAINTLQNGNELYIPAGTWSLNAPIKAWNGLNYLGGLDNIRIRGEGGRSIGSNGTRLLWFLNDYTGSAATLAQYGNRLVSGSLATGGTGQNMMLLTGCTGITTTMASELVGMPCRVWGASVNDNNVASYVTGIPANGQLLIWNDRPGATVTDANNGAIGWRVERSCLDLRLREVALQDLVMQCIGDIGCLLNITESPSPNNTPGQSSITISNNVIENVLMHADGASQKVRFGIRLAIDTIPDSNHQFYSVNGAGTPQVYKPAQVDVTDYRDFRFVGNIASKCSAVGGYSRSGQGKNHMFYGGIFQGVRNGWTVPFFTANAGDSNLCHANFFDMGIGFCFDTMFDVAASSFDTRIRNCQGETGNGRFLQDRGNIGPGAVMVDGCYLYYNPFDSGPGHPSWEVCTVQREGAICIRDSNFYFGGNNTKYRVLGLYSSRSADTTKNAGSTVNFTGNTIGGYASQQGRRGFIQSSVRGPFVFSGTETFVFSVQVAGVTTPYTVTCTQSAFNAACGYTVTMSEVRAFEIALLIEAAIGTSIVRAYGNEDDTVLRVYNVNETPGGINTISCTGTAATKVGFSGTGSSSARVQFNIDTMGIIDGGAQSATTACKLVFESNALASYDGSAYEVTPNIRKIYGSTQKDFFSYGTVRGIAGIGARGDVSPVNFNGSQAFANTDTRKTVTFTQDGNANPEADANYMVTSLVVTKTAGSTGPAVGAYRAHAENLTANGFDIVLEASAGSGGDATATVSVAWMVTR